MAGQGTFPDLLGRVWISIVNPGVREALNVRTLLQVVEAVVHYAI
jgi:hypothetical protein